MGGRYCSLVVGDAEDPVPALGLLLLGYPLHAAGRPDQPRAEHFGRLRVPVLFASGTRDSLAGKADLTKAARRVKGPVSFHWIDSADHGYRPLKSSGRTSSDVLSEVATVSADWVRVLPRLTPGRPPACNGHTRIVVERSSHQRRKPRCRVPSARTSRAVERIQPQRDRLREAHNGFSSACESPSGTELLEEALAGAAQRVRRTRRVRRRRRRPVRGAARRQPHARPRRRSIG